MNKEFAGSEISEKSEAREIPVVSQEQVIQSPESLRNQMTSESLRETDRFKGECADDLAKVVARAEKDGLTVGAEDRDALEILAVEADSAHAELLNAIMQEEIYPPDPEDDEVAPPIASELLIPDPEDEISIPDPEDDELPSLALDESTIEQAADPESYEQIMEGVNSSLHKIDESLSRLEGAEYLKYIEEIKNLPPDAVVHLYHGLKGDNYDGVLDIINSKTHGIEQRSGPTLSLVPVGQFWHNSLGFRYSLKRDQVEFPGEKNPNAVVRIGGEGGIQDIGYIEDVSGNPSSLPLTQFEGEIMYGEGARLDKLSEEKINERLMQFAKIRSDLNDINNNIAIEQKTKFRDLLIKAKDMQLFQFGSPLARLTRKGFSPLEVSSEQLMGESSYGEQADDFIREVDSRLQQLTNSIEQYRKDGSQDEYSIRKQEDEKEVLTQLRDEVVNGTALVRRSVARRM